MTETELMKQKQTATTFSSLFLKHPSFSLILSTIAKLLLLQPFSPSLFFPMATPPANIEEPSEPLKYTTWVLKVSIHCQGCQKKVKKVLSSIQGVHNFEVDLKLQRVVVTGHIDPDALIYKLNKSGRNAELWPGLYNQKQNTSGQDKEKSETQTIAAPSDDNHGEKQKQKQVGIPATAEPNDATVGGDKVVQVEVVSTAKVNQADNTTAGIPASGLTAGSIPMNKVEMEKSVGKKKKKKGQNGNMSGGQKEEEEQNRNEEAVSAPCRTGPQHKNSVTPPIANNNPPRQLENQYPPRPNNNPPRQLENQYPPRPNNNPPRQLENQYPARPNKNPPRQLENQYPPTNYYAPTPVNYVMSYNMAHPTPNYTTSYYDSPTPSYYYSSAEPPPSDYHPETPAYVNHQQQPLDSFELFSDENPNGCSVM